MNPRLPTGARVQLYVGVVESTDAMCFENVNFYGSIKYKCCHCNIIKGCFYRVIKMKFDNEDYQQIKEADKLIIELKNSISTNEIEDKINNLDETMAKLMLKRIFVVCWPF
jgi:hypothetical protein